MNNYRKKDVINDLDIDAFETIEINKIQSNFKTKRSFKKAFKFALIAPVLILAFVFSVNLFNGNDINPALENIKLAELNAITLSDLPKSLQGVQEHSASNLQFLNNFTRLNTSITFEDEKDVTGEAQLLLEEIINDQTMTNEAKNIFDDLYQNILYLSVDEVSTFDKVHEYYFTVNEDGTYKLTMHIEENEKVTAIELVTYYQDEEFFYQVTLEETTDTTNNLLRIQYNQDETKKYQYAKHETEENSVERYVAIEQTDFYTSVVAISKVNGNTHEIVANANDSHGVIFSAFESPEANYTSTEYYNGDGALLKQEQGFIDLTFFNQFLDQVYQSLEENPDVNLKNLSTQIPDFNDPESFVIEISLLDSAKAHIEDVEATLTTDTNTYNIDYRYNDFLHSKKEDTFTSGDTMYHLTYNQTTDSTLQLTYTAMYQVPEAILSPNNQSYYVINKYMAKYIEAADGFSIDQKTNGKYELINNDILGQLGDRIDIDIQDELYYIDGEQTSVKTFQHTCDIQFENIVFTELDTINDAKVNITELYLELMPTDTFLQENFQSIDLSMFTN